MNLTRLLALMRKETLQRIYPPQQIEQVGLV